MNDSRLILHRLFAETYRGLGKHHQHIKSGSMHTSLWTLVWRAFGWHRHSTLQQSTKLALWRPSGHPAEPQEYITNNWSVSTI